MTIFLKKLNQLKEQKIELTKFINADYVKMKLINHKDMNVLYVKYHFFAVKYAPIHQ